MASNIQDQRSTVVSFCLFGAFVGFGGLVTTIAIQSIAPFLYTLLPMEILFLAGAISAEKGDTRNSVIRTLVIAIYLRRAP